MFKLLLILRYLRRKLAPLFAALAVTLCTAMVIIVISVMGGFLQMMENAARTLSGDVTIHADLGGIPHFDELIEELDAQSEIKASTPLLQSLGLLKQYGRVSSTEVIGIRPQSFHTVTGFRDTLHWSQDDLAQLLSGGPPGPDMDPIHWAMQMRPPTGTEGAAMVAGIEVSPGSYRDPEGQYQVGYSSLLDRTTLTLLPVTRGGTVLEPAVRELTVVNEFKSGLYDIDANRIYVPFRLMQVMLKMDPAMEADPETGELTGKMTPGRASFIMVRGADGTPLADTLHAVREVTDRFQRRHPQTMAPLVVRSWRQQHATLLGAVEKEKFLLTILFAIISLVAVTEIATIFYMIVLEKTRDIGTLRALGASRGGIASIFLGYGLAIGILGASLGLGLAAAVVLNINEIQAWLNDAFGLQVWNPQIYYFDRIPTRLDPTEVTVIMLAAIASSVLGSVVPALLAARLDPVESLRYE
ncbi:MAG: FtsX-like permease family protein [Phycisphaeraceae bacterium]|nr:FtsX-like permease family protein [Phycisphaeraceae bacterium]